MIVHIRKRQSTWGGGVKWVVNILGIYPHGDLNGIWHKAEFKERELRIHVTTIWLATTRHFGGNAEIQNESTVNKILSPALTTTGSW